jgi:hypothetical protein
LNFAVCDNLLDFRRPSSITTVHDKLDQAPPTFEQLTPLSHVPVFNQSAVSDSNRTK